MYFYSRPYARGDLNELERMRASDISTHAPTRGATCVWANLIVWFLVFLLTPLREGRQTVEQLVCFLRVISTHAPARGATPAAQCGNS